MKKTVLPITRFKVPGLGLIETMVAMVILLTAVAAGANLVSSLTTADVVNRDRFQATYLAQECLEILRNNRDTNWLQNRPWQDTQFVEKEINELSAPFNTPFIRTFQPKTLVEQTIEIDTETRQTFPTQIRYTCTVEWNNIAGEQTLSLSQILTNWRQK